jgi:hypothetical protein
MVPSASFVTDFCPFRTAMDDTYSTAGPLPRPSFAVIGADAFLAARPATPVQVVHACSRAGYDATVPATWGDELIAARCIERLAERTLAPAIFCACSLVRDRLLAPGPDLLPFVLSFVSPPVAAARYLRQLYAGRSVDITYVGACPSADDEAIDRVVTPVAFFAELRARGISLSHQPTVFDSTFAPDRRRCLSQPGGLPAPALLDNHAIGRRITEIGSFEYAADLAQHLILSEPVLIDISARAGCVCAGAAIGVPPLETRRTVVALEPPRSAQPIVEPGVQVMIDLPLAPPPDGDGPEPTYVEPGNDRPEDDRERVTDGPEPTMRHVPEAVQPRMQPRMERRAGPGRRVFDQTFDVQFDSAFREAFEGALDRSPPAELQRAEPLVAVAERTMVESVLAMRRRTERRVPTARVTTDDGRPVALPRAYVARRTPATPTEHVIPIVPIETIAPPPDPIVPVVPVVPVVPIQTLRLEDQIVRIPVDREPPPVRAVRATVRPRAPRLADLRRRPVGDAWHQTTRWFRRIPASTYIISFAAVTAAAVFVGITVRARHNFQLTAQQPH